MGSGGGSGLVRRGEMRAGVCAVADAVLAVPGTWQLVLTALQTGAQVLTGAAEEPVSQVEPPRHRYGGHEVSGFWFFLVDEPSTGDLNHCRSTTCRQHHRVCSDTRTRLRDTP